MENNKNYKLAVDIFGVLIYSEDVEERNEAKNDLIELSKVSPEAKKSIKKAYDQERQSLNGLEDSDEYGILLEIGKILGFN